MTLLMYDFDKVSDLVTKLGVLLPDNLMGDGPARRLSPFIPDPGGEMIFLGRHHIFAVVNDGKAVVVGDDRFIGIDLERLAISLDREPGIHEPESFDLSGCRSPLAADQLLAEAGGMRMMIFELDDCGPSAKIGRASCRERVCQYV